MTVSRTAVGSVTFYWWLAVNKAVSPCDLSIVFVQLLLEHHIQVIHTSVDEKSKASNIKYILYTICREWSRGDVMNSVCYFQQ